LDFNLSHPTPVILAADSDWHYDKSAHYPEPFFFLQFRLCQTNTDLYFKNYYAPAELSDLGAGTLADLAGHITGNESGHNVRTVHFVNGHVYLLKARSSSGRVWMLFKIEDISSADPQQHLKELKQQFDQGKINQDDYEQRKKEILDSL
jgi:hypothetical protein